MEIRVAVVVFQITSSTMYGTTALKLKPITPMEKVQATVMMTIVNMLLA